MQKIISIKTRLRTIQITSIILIFALIATGVFALFSSVDIGSTTAAAGTVYIGDPNLRADEDT